jgi:UDP-N-acetylglucosamine diphosphorylase/glucosamine-1-phosphate N-acetyltransferase
MRVCLFEDQAVAGLEPLTLTRPVFDLLCGLTPLADKQCRPFGTGPRGALVRPSLAALCRLNRPDWHVNDAAWLAGRPVILVNGRWLPAAAPPAVSGPCVGVVGDEVAFAVVGPEQAAACSPQTLPAFLEEWRTTLPAVEAGGCLVRHLWELVQLNGEQILHDWAAAPHRPLPRSAAPPALVGPCEQLSIDPSARLDPLVVADTTNGPVVIERAAVVGAFTRLEGPCVVGPGTHVLGAKVRAGTTLGPDCRIGGEVEASIVQGRSNKYHDGFLGHAYVGEWVNLGAGTHNSDLRNDYGEVRVLVNGRLVRTGLSKVGCFIGDHTKTALGTLLNTGTSVGVFCSLLPGGLLPRYVPSFATCEGQRLSERADPFALFRTAEAVMRRRGLAFDAAHEELYRTLYEETAAECRRAVREAEARILRRSA